MKIITVFTPTYNRAYCLHQLYDSLCRQTSQDFLWLLIDDGSTDNTKQLVESWIKEGKIEIQYKYKENGGMHTGHNAAYELINTELNVCIDSDDYMPDDAVALIINKWKAEGSKEFAGLLGLDIDKKGNSISTKFPENLKSCKYSELKRKHGVVGDIKFVYRTEIIKEQMPYPVFETEKFVPLGYPYAVIDKNYDMLCSNDVYCVVEYMPDGSTLNIIKQYFRHPKGFAHERKVLMVTWPYFIDRFRYAMHYVSSSIILKNKKFINESPSKTLTVLAIIPGILLYIYISYKNRII
jgi:glycosyltransferase involved in cell wall biosynthesis